MNPESWIDAKTLREAFERIHVDPRSTFGPIRGDKIRLNPEENSYVLGAEMVHGYVFVMEGNLFCTIHDHPSMQESPPEIVEACGFRFTRRALESMLSTLQSR
jgi:hypothetical protein